MAAGADLRVDPDGDGGRGGLLGGDEDQPFQFRRRFNVDLAHTDVDGEGQFGVGLAHAGEDDALAGNARRQGATDLALGHGVGAAAELGQGRQHRQVGVGLDRKGDQSLAQRGFVGVAGVTQQTVVTAQGGRGIDIGRGPDLRRQRLQ
ncbi:hypothetical protein D3C85_994400 [compost metagenome]